MKQLIIFYTEVIYAMRPMKDKKMVSLFPVLADVGWGGGRGLWGKIDKPRSQLFQMHLIPKCLAEWGANIVNILIVTLNLTILDATWEEIKYGTKSKRVAFVTVSHIFANLSV